MPVSFPSTVPLRNPFSRTLSVPTRVIEMLDGSEQRWCAGDPLHSVALEFQNVSAAEVAAIRTWFDTIKGAYDSTWDLIVAGTTYPDMALEQDDLSVVESGQPERFSLSLKMRQTFPDGDYVIEADPEYPALVNGVYTQRPFTRNAKFLTTRNDLASGPRYAWYERASALRAWVCEYPVITLSELESRLEFFIAMRGKFKAFTFHDPQSDTDVSNCRFDTDQFVARNSGPDHWSVSLPVVEFLVVAA